jgi:general secretion pathway protein E
MLVTPTPEELQGLGLDPNAFFRGEIQIPKIKGALELPRGKVFRAKGCHACLDTGYTGRSGIYELLMMNDEVRQLCLKNADSTTIKRAAMGRGMRNLRQDGALKVLAGLTTIEEVMMITAEDLI